LPGPHRQAMCTDNQQTARRATRSLRSDTIQRLGNIAAVCSLPAACCRCCRRRAALCQTVRPHPPFSCSCMPWCTWRSTRP
jgi:hypothetical protein